MTTPHVPPLWVPCLGLAGLTFTKEAAKAMTEEEKADDAYDETNSSFRLGGS